ncbi:MAG TPA: hypothetical protein DEG17_17905 [Cyanobacteria bacterium UBA11149]|nr:hypothetical protein [Cyanobacteria bacterium UBA11367]HBE60258.1 hypothetical protein [Cyanobacteria bacterium UBA11366]HBK62228.1 hypothetical protein [Cyanobacteria bacterium UBA11166]HBR74315.1 hypothetical protein [Cyanobacteria bacterium UBA11159]HBS68531.1 hypothetical protein [Cyanobacteria bacterium UBA11153]HBW90693.1 hypothetical protein [Cyanobacteria bacterium UBA11149]HCA94444.1 hypothetical protein [Cyanobacteria bacterium UBA9226]
MSRSSSLFVAIAATAATVLGSVIGFTGEAFAGNVRPVQPLGPSDDGVELQDIFDDLYRSGVGVDAIDDQISAALFENTAVGGSVSSFVAEIAGFAGKNKIGLYNKNLTKALLYDGVNDDGDTAFVTFLEGGDLSIITKGFAPKNKPPLVDKLYEKFGNCFGFYIETPEGNTFYSEDWRNPNGDAQVLIYQGENDTVLQLPNRAKGLFTDNEFLIAFEDKVYANSDKDFNDAVISFESILPKKDVPEPGAVVGLLAIGSFGVSQMLKRHKQENKN